MSPDSPPALIRGSHRRRHSAPITAASSPAEWEKRQPSRHSPMILATENAGDSRMQKSTKCQGNEPATAVSSQSGVAFQTPNAAIVESPYSRGDLKNLIEGPNKSSAELFGKAVASPNCGAVLDEEARLTIDCLEKPVRILQPSYSHHVNVCRARMSRIRLSSTQTRSAIPARLLLEPKGADSAALRL